MKMMIPAMCVMSKIFKNLISINIWYMKPNQHYIVQQRVEVLHCNVDDHLVALRALFI